MKNAAATTELDAAIARFAAVCQEQYRAYIRSSYPVIAASGQIDGPGYQVTVKRRRKYTAVDFGSSGRYLVDPQGIVWSIKAYGVPNYRLGTVADLTARIAGAPFSYRVA